MLLYIVRQDSPYYHAHPYNMPLASLYTFVIVSRVNWAESLTNVLVMKWLVFWFVLHDGSVSSQYRCLTRFALSCFTLFSSKWEKTSSAVCCLHQRQRPVLPFFPSFIYSCFLCSPHPARVSLCDLTAPLGAKLWAPRCRSRWAAFCNLHNYARCVQ